MGGAGAGDTPGALTLLEQAARDRDRAAEASDRASEARDRLSQTRDDVAGHRDGQAGFVDLDAAAADREWASRDRQGSVEDRAHAQRDRAAASQDRQSAAAERAGLMTDGLTGALHRAPGLAGLDREVLRARRTGQSFVLAFLDVDGLKTVNDTRGHAAGDAVLRELVDAVRRTVREYDLIVRYGGDEFVCGLVGVTLHDAAARFAVTRSQPGSNGAAFSVGLALLAETESLDALIARADTAMYESRRSGAGDGRGPQP